MDRTLRLIMFSGVSMLVFWLPNPGDSCGPWFPESLLRTPYAAIQPPRPSLEIELEKIDLDISLPGNLSIPDAMPARSRFDSPIRISADVGEWIQSLPPEDILENRDGCRDRLQNSTSELGREIAELAQILHHQTKSKSILDQKAAATTLLEYRDIRSGMFGVNKDPVLPPIIQKREWPTGLPREFPHYLNGAAAFRESNFEEARRELKALLALPPGERQHRSIWAHFLLGRIELKEGDEGLVKSIAHFRAVLDLFEKGFHDSLGMRWDSLKCIADHENFRKDRDWKKVMKYYFALARAGQPYCLTDLKRMAKKCNFSEAAQDRVIRQIVTAVQLGSRSDIRYWEPTAPEAGDLEEKWLSALESAQVTAPEANRLAWLAYNNGQFSRARRFLDQAGQKDAMGCWVEGKLALQKGSPYQARRCLARAASSFPRSRTDHIRTYFESGPYATHHDVRDYQCSQYWGDLGMVRLANNDFLGSLDALVRSGYWYDAAYVAEQLLSREELLSYVRRYWPEPVGEYEGEENYYSYWAPRSVQNGLRYLTARRLARDHYFKDARAFFPKKIQPVFDYYVKQYRSFRGGDLEEEERARVGWELAQIHRSLGMELFGTEVGPDWFCLNEGNFSAAAFGRCRLNVAPSERLSRLRRGEYRNPVFPDDRESGWDEETLFRTGKQLDPTPDERWRFRHYADLRNTNRFHYRHVAADLAWEASRFLPDDTDLKAEILNTAGRWIAVHHPKAADVFYKSLAGRNRNTLLGMDADTIRWFVRRPWDFDPWEAAGVKKID